MKKKKIELEVINISSSQAQAGAFALLMQEVGGPRQLPVIIGAAEAQALLIELRGIVPPRPLTHALFSSVLEVLGVKLLEVVIYQAVNGVFFSYIFFRHEGTVLRVDSRTSDAVALAVRMKAPIRIYEELLNRECLQEEFRQEEASSDGLTAEERIGLLKESLKRAVEEEKYELAAEIRDEINKIKES